MGLVFSALTYIEKETAEKRTRDSENWEYDTITTIVLSAAGAGALVTAGMLYYVYGTGALPVEQIPVGLK
jgi:hypothetical protein